MSLDVKNVRTRPLPSGKEGNKRIERPEWRRSWPAGRVSPPVWTGGAAAVALAAAAAAAGAHHPGPPETARRKDSAAPARACRGRASWRHAPCLARDDGGCDLFKAALREQLAFAIEVAPPSAVFPMSQATSRLCGTFATNTTLTSYLTKLCAEAFGRASAISVSSGQRSLSRTEKLNRGAQDRLVSRT